MFAKTSAHDGTDVLLDRCTRESGGNKETDVVSVISGLSWTRTLIAMAIADGSGGGGDGGPWQASWVGTRVAGRLERAWIGVAMGMVGRLRDGEPERDGDRGSTIRYSVASTRPIRLPPMQQSPSRLSLRLSPFPQVLRYACPLGPQIRY